MVRSSKQLGDGCGLLVQYIIALFNSMYVYMYTVYACTVLHIILCEYVQCFLNGAYLIQHYLSSAVDSGQ